MEKKAPRTPNWLIFWELISVVSPPFCYELMCAPIQICRIYISKRQKFSENLRKTRPNSKSWPHPTTVQIAPSRTAAVAAGRQMGRTWSVSLTGSASLRSAISLRNPESTYCGWTTTCATERICSCGDGNEELVRSAPRRATHHSS